MSEQIATLIPHIPADEGMAKYILEILLRHYPGHPWVVEAFTGLGYATIQNFSLSTKMGMRLIFPKILTSSDLDLKIMKYGGEFLERHGVARKKADQDQTLLNYKTARFK